MVRTSRSSSRRRGWVTVAGLTAALSGAVALQLPAANATPDAAPVTRAALSVLPLTTSAATLREDPSTTTPLRAAQDRAVAARARARAEAAARAAAADRSRAAAPAASRASRPTATRPATTRQTGSLCSGAGWQARRGAAALASLRAGAARTGFRVEFAPARSGYMGLTHLQQRRIEVFVRSCAAQSDELLRHVVAHELGHAWDTTRMSPARRAAWQRVRGIPAGTPWYGCSGCTDFATPAGDFAEVYAQWVRGASSNRSRLAGDVAPAQLASLARQFFGA